ncbi:MAG: pilus assembly protein PilP [Gammaproteobacteria bacterium]
MTALLVACADTGMRDLESYVEDVKARPAGPVPPIPEIQQAASFVYVPGDRRDPFTPEEEGDLEPTAEDLAGPRPDLNRRKEELEGYSLDTMRMVGTLEQEATIWGLVQTSDGTIHRVHEGNYLGRNHGRIVRINEDEIELTELVPNGRGGWIERQQAVALSAEQ